MNKTALITGATSGIGKATTIALVKHGYDVIITGRRSGLLEELKNEIQDNYNGRVNSLCFDVRNNQEVTEAINSLTGDWKNIEVLVNNAGLAAGFDDFEDASLDDWEAMLDTNVKGLLYVSKLIVPLMIKFGKGHIVNIGSVAGKEVYPKGNVYCASKYAVDAITQGMRIDLLKYGIRVSQICPGMVETEFALVRFKQDAQRAKKVYDGLIPLYAEDIADAIMFMITRPAHVNINDMIIMPTAQASAVIVKRN
jgi:NADP-dependent 3-hydroxy acid dehydrogenase YdfG